MKKLLIRDVLKALTALKPQGDPVFSARYVGGVGHEKRKVDEQSHLKFLGLKMPQVDQIEAQVDFSKVDFKTLKTRALKTRIHEELTLLLALLDRLDLVKKFSVKDLQPFIACIDNWATSDQLSSVLARAFERNPTDSKPLYRKWCANPNPWMRRQSIVGLYYYASQRERYPDPRFVISQIKNLLDDPHFYVQKGVGWTLRELFNAEPEMQRAFVRSHLKRIQPTAWYATAEKYSVAERQRLVKQRRA